MADLIDNSIEAGANNVWIDVEFNGDDSTVRIADDGIGMNKLQLKEAMRYGSEREYDDEKDLGKFGLGLKTASLSQCQRLSVASHISEKGSIIAYCWDLNHIERTNKWEVFEPSKNELKKILGERGKKFGTVVFWEGLDRILGYKHPYDDPAKRRLMNMCRELENHLGMVFHRFLNSEVPGRRLEIILNGNRVKPWDPFARGEEKTIGLDTVKIQIEHEGVSGKVVLEPYVLPHQDDFSSREAFNLASGPSNWNQQQGFYIYRANRMIQSGGWSRLRTADEHTKLARVALSFSPHLDDAFKINVAKMKVQIPNQIRDQIENAIKPIVKLAQKKYRRNEAPPVIANPRPIGNQGGGSEAPSDNGGHKYPVQSLNSQSKLWKLEELETELHKIANSEEHHIVTILFDRLRKSIAKKP